MRASASARVDGVAVTNVAAYDTDAIALRVVEVGEVKGGDGVSPCEQVAGEIDAQEARAAGDEEGPGLAHRCRVHTTCGRRVTYVA